MAAVITADASLPRSPAHAAWVRCGHWVIAAAVLTLAFSGFEILMVHPRLYWGKAGNDLTPALVELPISRNYRHGGWAAPVVFVPGAHPVVSAARTYDIFNQNGWGRSLHFLAAWFLVVGGALYFGAAALSGHLRRNLLPAPGELSPARLAADIRAHLHRPDSPVRVGPPYNLLQKLSYAAVMWLVLPFMLLSGLTMSPSVTAAVPGLLDLFGGSQSARTLHCVGFGLLVIFLIVHLVMVVLTGFGRQMRAMTLGD